VRLVGVVMAATWGCGPSSAEPEAEPEADSQRDTLSAMTFNIFHDAATDLTRGNIAPWEARRDLVAGTVAAADADVVGLQEAFPWQVDWLRLQLPHYEHFGRGSATDGSGWSVAILFKAEELALEESGHFWLSSTPDVPGSAGGEGWAWTGAPRIVSWVRLGFERSGRQLYVYNAHLPPPEAGTPSRTRSVLLLAERIAARSRPEVPFVLLGDLNASEDEFTIRYLEGDAWGCPEGTCPDAPPRSPFTAIDTWRAVNADQQGTRCRNDDEGRRLPRTFGERVDYVFVSELPPEDEATGSPPEILRSSIFTFGSSCASDHLPVLSHLVPPIR
jgi:endonuclease/exonuclease/phosphatase family metal-dependent hydrolase